MDFEIKVTQKYLKYYQLTENIPPETIEIELTDKITGRIQKFTLKELLEIMSNE